MLLTFEFLNLMTNKIKEFKCSMILQYVYSDCIIYFIVKDNCNIQ